MEAERAAPPGDPVCVLGADGAECHRVGAAAVQAEQRRVRAGHLAQLGQYARHGGGEPGRLAAGKAHRAAGLGAPALGVPAARLDGHALYIKAVVAAFARDCQTALRRRTEPFPPPAPGLIAMRLQWGEDESRTRSGKHSPMACLPWFR